MQKIESAVIAVVPGIAFPFIVTYLVSGGSSSSFLIPCASAGSGVCTVGTVAGNVITLPQILVSTANLVITLLTGLLIIFALHLRSLGGDRVRGGARWNRQGRRLALVSSFSTESVFPPLLVVVDLGIHHVRGLAGAVLNRVKRLLGCARWPRNEAGTKRFPGGSIC